MRLCSDGGYGPARNIPFVVVGLEHEDVQLVERSGNAFRDVTEVVNDSRSDAFTQRRHYHANRLIGVVRDRNRLEIEITDD